MAALVNSWTSPFPGNGGTWGSGYYDGLGVIETSHSAGNTIVAFVGWANIDDTTANVVSPVPVSSVADDAHNFWIPLITSSSSGNYRCAIWICPNAKQGDPVAGLTRISVSLSSGAFLLGFKVCEFSGMPLVATPSGMENSNFSNSAASINVTGTATGNAWGFAMSCGRVPTVGNPGAPWTTITEFDPVSRTNTTMAIAMSWGNIPSGAQSVTFTPPGTAAVSACLAGVLQTPVVPTQPNPNRPRVKVEAAFGHQAGDLSTMPTWTDITPYAIQPNGGTTFSASRGKAYELTTPEAGDGQVWLRNNTGDWNPLNASGAFYPNVTLGLPVRMSAFWNNRWHWLAKIQAKQLPQQWPDPQWGMSPLSGYDSMGILANAELLSAYQQEILRDNPYAFWPLSESYTQANGLPFGNIVPGNLRPMVGIDGASDSNGTIVPLQTGQALGLNGDLNGGIGISTINTSPRAWSAGAFCMDPNFPQYNTASGITVEFWAILTQPQSGSAVIPMITLAGASSNWATSNYGPVRYQLVWESLGFGTITVNVADVNGTLAGGPGSAVLLTGPTAHHFVIHISGATHPIVDLYVDGALLMSPFTAAGTTSSGDIQGLFLGPSTNFCPGLVANNYSIGQVAVYSGRLTADRIAEHYQAGINAFTGESVLTRFSHLMTWGQTGVPMAADKGSVTPLVGYCDTIESQAVSDAITDLVTSEGGSAYAAADGTVFYQSRQTVYNRSPKYTFGDNPPDVMNPNWNFVEPTLAKWSAFQCSIALDGTTTTGGYSQSAKYTPDGVSTVSAIEQATAVCPPVIPGASYMVTALCLSPTGYNTVQVGVDWLDASNVFISAATTTVSIAASTWTILTSASLTAPANAAKARVRVGEAATPAVGNTLNIQYARLSTFSTEVPYEPDQSFDMDIIYLYNRVRAQRQVSQTKTVTTAKGGGLFKQLAFNDGALVLEVDTASETQYAPRAILDQTILTTSDQDAYDWANWKLNKYKGPGLRVPQIKLDPMSNPAIWEVALSVEQGDIVQVNRRPVGAPPYTVLGIVQEVDHNAGPDSWEVTLSISPYTIEQNVLQLDTAGFNTLGSNRIGW